MVTAALCLASCAHADPPSTGAWTTRATFDRFVSELSVPPHTRVLAASLYDEITGSFRYVLVVGDEAIRNVTRGRPVRVRLPETGLAEVLARFDRANVASLHGWSEREADFIHSGEWRVEVRQDGMTAQFGYDCVNCRPQPGLGPQTDLLRQLIQYLGDDYDGWPDLAQPPRP